MPTIVFLATAWGPRAGGINTFNMEIAQALAKVVGSQWRVVCVVPKGEEAPQIKPGAVTIVPLGVDRDDGFDPGWVGTTSLRLQAAGVGPVVTPRPGPS